MLGGVFGHNAGGMARDGARQAILGTGGVDLHLDPVHHSVQVVDRRSCPDGERLQGVLTSLMN